MRSMFASQSGTVSRNFIGNPAASGHRVSSSKATAMAMAAYTPPK